MNFVGLLFGDLVFFRALEKPDQIADAVYLFNIVIMQF